MNSISKKNNVLYEDEVLLVVDKTGGIPSLSEPGGIDPSLAAWVLHQWPACATVSDTPTEAGLVHRLDNDTSGCLLVAKTRTALHHLRAQFAARTVEKEYLALLIGFAPIRATFAHPIAHHPRRPHRMLVCETPEKATRYRSQSAVTTLTRRDVFPPAVGRPAPYSFCIITIHTGVRHQIRAHCAAAGHPVAGDLVYQSPVARRIDRLPLSRHFLHANRIAFRHPTNEIPMTIESPLPTDLLQILTHLQKGTFPGL